MSNMLIKCYELYLVAIYALLVSHLLMEIYLHADETTLQVLHEPGRKAQQKSYEWVYRTGAAAKRKIVVYIYKETREQKHPQDFLTGWKGHLHADGYQGYHDLGGDIIIVGCWQHVRSKFENSWKLKPEGKRKGSREEAALQYIRACSHYRQCTAFEAIFRQSRRISRRVLEAHKRNSDEEWRKIDQKMGVGGSGNTP